MSAGLAAFLLARIAEDEEWARLSAGPDYSDGEPGTPGHSARVLAECEAHRRIVDYWKWFHDPLDNRATSRALDLAVRALAAVYADHPDYDPTWRP